jgi:phosphatidyl-myo-inositol dimannoside synthase
MTGGISTYMGAIASTLGSRQACCLTAVPGEANGTGVRTYRRPWAFRKERHFQGPGFAAAIAEIMLRERPQVVQLATAYDGYIGMWLRRWFRLPFVVYAHGNEILDARQSSWAKPRLSLFEAARVLANSRFTAHLVEQLGVSAAKLEVIHPGCDVERLKPCVAAAAVKQEFLGEHSNGRVLLSVGNLVMRKGHDMVIQALPRLVKSFPELVYLIVGDGPHRGELENLAQALGVRERVIFAGRVSNERLREVYALAEVFVMPSRERLDACDVEGFGMVFLEASACGKAVVAGRSGGVEDAVVDGVTGLLVDPADVNELASAVSALLSHREFAARLGSQGRSRAVAQFAWSRVGERVGKVLECVLAEQQLRSRL